MHVFYDVFLFQRSEQLAEDYCIERNIGRVILMNLANECQSLICQFLF